MTNLQAIDLLKGLEQSLDDYCELNDEGKTAFRMGITALELFGNAEQLPTVQPEIHFDEWCTDCKEYDHEKHCCPRFNKVIRETVEELKAQPKTGKWINGHWDGDSNFRIDGRGNCWYIRECSNCHEEIKGKPTKYCPKCGARMEGD